MYGLAIVSSNKIYKSVLSYGIFGIASYPLPTILTKAPGSNGEI